MLSSMLSIFLNVHDLFISHGCQLGSGVGLRVIEDRRINLEHRRAEVSHPSSARETGFILSPSPELILNSWTAFLESMMSRLYSVVWSPHFALVHTWRTCSIITTTTWWKTKISHYDNDYVMVMKHVNHKTVKAKLLFATFSSPLLLHHFHPIQEPGDKASFVLCWLLVSVFFHHCHSYIAVHFFEMLVLCLSGWSPGGIW